MITAIGIESTAHTFGVGIITENGDILADKRSIYKPKKGGGILPREAVEHHTERAVQTIHSALKRSKKTLDEIDIIAVALGPGLPPCLRVGATFARYLAQRHKKPLVSVNHPIAHIEIGRLTSEVKTPVVVYLSGGNTQIIALVEGRYRIFGETEDIPVGNALDIVARQLGLEMPGGPKIEKLASKGSFTKLPYVVKGMDLSFSGIVSDAINILKKGVKPEDVCFSLQEVCFSMLTEVSERALAHMDKSELLLVGGVAANKRLQKMMKLMCEERDVKFFVVDPKYSGDNGVMIAWSGILAYKAGDKINIRNSYINQNWRTDEVGIKWI